jgi:cytochrome c-type biogenesis protein
MQPDLVNLIVLPLGLGLLGFIEPCSIGSGLLFVQYVEGKTAAVKLAQALTFTVTRALIVGLLGAIAAFVGMAFIGFQRAGWLLLGAIYVALGIVYVTGKATVLMRTLGPRALTR